MAKANNNDSARITRISASDTSSSSRKTKKTPKATPKATRNSKQEPATAGRRVVNPFRPVVRYVKGAWYELRQVRWPDRRSTWGMTGALIAFTVFFLVVIILLDAGFQQLFKLIIGK
ncbi:MAG TPA: preprotein translocase subunit SecE [Candidatus Saccharimonas sp.]|nr:preprotein translocase subunit SecE [Candidatus Saccharimonas sp.]